MEYIGKVSDVLIRHNYCIGTATFKFIKFFSIRSNYVKLQVGRKNYQFKHLKLRMNTIVLLTFVIKLKKASLFVKRHSSF